MPTITANGIPLYYNVDGEGDPVLWIQGLGADHSAWLQQLYTFRHSFRCIAFDNRDVGRSALVETPYTVVDMAADAAGLIAALGLGPVHVVGLSLGSSIAQELALRHPQLVRTLTLVGALARSDARLQALLDVWPDLYRKLEIVEFYRQALPWLFSARFFEQPRQVRAMLHYVANHPQPADAFARQAAAGRNHDTLARLPLVRVPVLVVAGEEDVLVPLRLSRVLAAAIPGASLVVIPNAAHGMNVEQPAAFNNAVLQFLRSN